jgi:ornithine cyclodeaminase/alanine dehydrogenase-like protein (mu-crystallin family)
MRTRKLLVLDRSAVGAALDWDALLPVTRDALVDLASSGNDTSMAAQMLLPGAALHVKGGAVKAPPLLSLKANLRPDAGSSDGAILVFDHGATELRAVLASGDLTARRTAAIAAVAARALGADGHSTVAVLGSGPLGRAVDSVLSHLGLGREVRLWSRSSEGARRVAAVRWRSDRVRVCDGAADAVTGADVVITCTPAREPIVRVEDLDDGVLVLAMGADSPGKRELADGVLDGARLFADVPSDALAVGEFARLPPGEAERVVSLGAHLAGGGRLTGGGGRTIVDSVGSPAVDAAVSAMVLDAASTSGSGTWVDF